MCDVNSEAALMMLSREIIWMFTHGRRRVLVCPKIENRFVQKSSSRKSPKRERKIETPSGVQKLHCAFTLSI